MDRRRFIRNTALGVALAPAAGLLSDCSKAPPPARTAEGNVALYLKRSRFKLFPTEVPSKEWAEFSAAGFSEPACGIVYRKTDNVPNGMPLGGVATGTLDLDTDGTFGYFNLFNSGVPTRGPLKYGFLGISVKDGTWILSTSAVTGIESAKDIYYWGHYPVADIEYELDAPMSVGMRAWSPFIPGDAQLSNTPGAIFEVHLRNISNEAQKGTLAFSFPGPTQAEAQISRISPRTPFPLFGASEPVAQGSIPVSRREVKGDQFSGLSVSADTGNGYVIGVIGADTARYGGGIWVHGYDYSTGQNWLAIRNRLPSAPAAAFKLVANSAGLYRTPPLQPGTYQITVTETGFQQLLRKGVVVTLGQPLGLNLTLSVGSVTQQVQVTGAPPLLRTQDSGLGQSVSYKAVAVLPMFNRDAGELVALSPTVRYFGEDHISYGSSRFDGAGIGNPQFYYNGAPIGGDRTDVDQMTFDPPVESISEARVVQNQYSAQYGSNPGQIVMFQSKQGTNEFHGSIYEYFRNEALDSFNGFTDTKPNDRQNIPGFTFGGPIKRNKAFFFTNLEIQRQTNPAGAIFTVPTSAMRGGDFSALGIPIYDPTTTITNPATGKLTRTQFPGNIIPSSEFDPVALNAVKYEPLPNQPGVTNNLLASGGNTADKNRLVGAFDYDINTKNTFHADYLLDLTTFTDNGWAPWNAINPHASPSGEALGFTFKTQVYNFQETHTFSSKFLTTAQFSYRPRYILREGAQLDPAGKWGQTLGLKGWAGSLLPVSYGGDMGFPQFNFSGYEGLGTGDLQFAEYPVNEYDYAQSFNYIRGKQSIGFGAGLERSEHGVQNQTTPVGSYNFSPLETGLPGVGGTGDAIASFLLGLVDNANSSLGPRLIYHEWYYYTWIEDDVKVTPSLTLNLGFRWDIDAPVYEAHDDGNGFNLYGVNPVSGTLGTVTFFGQNGVGGSFYNTDYHRFAPRFGFADEFAHNWVLRGGYGIYNISPILGANRGAPSLGFTTSASFSSPDGGVTPAFLLKSGFPSYPLGGDRALLTPGFGAASPGQAPSTSPSFVNPNWKFGYSQNFNLSIQHELPWDSMVEVAGQGVRGLALPISVNWNEVPPQFWGATGTSFEQRPFPQYNSLMQVQAASGYSNWYAGTVRFEKRFSNGLNLIANYAYQKSLGFMGGDIYLPNLNYGPALFDEANMPTGQAYQTGAIEGTYYLPAGPGKTYLTKGPLSEILGGWYVSGIFTRQSGESFDVGSGIDSLGDGGTSPLNGRANRVPGVDPYATNKSPSHWLNPAAFTAPAFGQIGNDCCGTLFGPAQTEFTVAVGKDFRLTERLGLRFSAECFNCTNTLQWGLPNANLSSPGFGVISGPLSEGANSDKPEVGQRIMQLGLKLTF